MNRWSALALLLAFAAALALRLPQLGLRPLHNDESINAHKLAALLERGEYRYDPQEFHGPSLYYASLPVLKLAGVRNAADMTDARLRLVSIVFGLGLLLLPLLLRDAIGDHAVVATALLTAISPAMVFYSRYFIHEMALVFFTVLTLVAGWRYWKSRKTGWAILGGAGVGLMWATKETFVFAVFAGLLALAATWLWNRWLAKLDSAPQHTMPEHPLDWKKLALDAAVYAITALGVGVILLSSFFANASGPLDSLRTYPAWISRAAGNSPHLYPWHFYAERLLWFHADKGPVWTEAAIAILALVGAAAAFAGNRALVPHPAFSRFIAAYTALLAVIYSAISYKTPWCLLGFWSGAILLAGVGASALWHSCRRHVSRALIGLALLAATGHLAFQAWRASGEFAFDRRNPYVFSQTLPAARELCERVEALAALQPDGRNMVIKIFSLESCWPLPWYLRSEQNVGYWERIPDDPFAPVVIVSANLNERLDERSNKRWLMARLYEIRPGVFFELYVESELWKRFVESRPVKPED